MSTIVAAATGDKIAGGWPFPSIASATNTAAKTTIPDQRKRGDDSRPHAVITKFQSHCPVPTSIKAATSTANMFKRGSFVSMQ